MVGEANLLQKYSLACIIPQMTKNLDHFSIFPRKVFFVIKLREAETTALKQGKVACQVKIDPFYHGKTWFLSMETA